jgi:hypothetical protein
MSPRRHQPGQLKPLANRPARGPEPRNWRPPCKDVRERHRSAWTDRPRRKERQMSYPYPQDRTRDKQTKGEQTYAEAREKLSESERDLETEAIAFGDAHQEADSEERRARLETEMEQRFAKINREVVERVDAQGGHRKTAEEG